MKDLMIILLGAVLTNNFVLSQFLGICPFLGVSKTFNGSVGMSAAVLFVMVMATAFTHPIYTYLLRPFGLDYLNTIVFILIIAAFVQLIELMMKKYMPPLHRSLGIYLPLITTNCAVLGVTLLNIENNYDFLQSIVNSLGAGLGFGLALILFSGVRERVDSAADIPNAFKGVPSTLIAASIVALSFMGFSGVVEGIFGV